MEQQFDRFKEAPWFSERAESVMIGGAGGIGSWLAFFLARAGFDLTIYDFDILEAHNIGGQLYRTEDVGLHKVDALYQILQQYTDTQVIAINDRITDVSPTHRFMFSAFDNMKARKDLFTVWKRSTLNSPVTPIFIDGRLEAEQMQIFCVTPANMKEYEEQHLFDDSEVDDTACSYRQTSHSAAMIAAKMCAYFTNHITNIFERENVREVPFYYEYFIPMNLTTEAV